MAEMSVPAWPIPIHQTKLTMAKPQPMGMLIPQIPTPLVNSPVIATSSSIVKAKVTVKPASHPIPSGRVRTTEAILSVTEAYVCPGPINGSDRGRTGEFTGGSAVLMPSPTQDSDCEQPQDTWCEAANSVRQGWCSCATGP